MDGSALFIKPDGIKLERRKGKGRLWKWKVGGGWVLVDDAVAVAQTGGVVGMLLAGGSGRLQMVGLVVWMGKPSLRIGICLYCSRHTR